MFPCLFPTCSNEAIYTAPNYPEYVPVACDRHRFDVVKFNLRDGVMNEPFIIPTTFFNDIKCRQINCGIAYGFHYAIMWISFNKFVFACANPGVFELYNIFTIVDVGYGLYAGVHTVNNKNTLKKYIDQRLE